MCVQVPCVYLLYAASSVTERNTNVARFLLRLLGLEYRISNVVFEKLSVVMGQDSSSSAWV